MLTTVKSGNSKLGTMASTYRSKDSCPVSCPIYRGCYSKYGIGNIQFDRATRQGLKEDASKIFQFLTTLPYMHKLRHFVGGDFTRNGKDLDKRFINAVIRGHEQRPDIQGFGYTHSWRLFNRNPFKQKSLTINASCENGKDAKLAKSKDFDVVMVVPHSTPNGKSNVDGINVLLCPNQASQRLIEAGKKTPLITCDKCMLCFKKNRDYAIGFLPHGAGQKHVPVS